MGGVVSFDLLVGDCLDVLSTLPSGSARTCITSPPYYGLRDYGVEGQIWQEPSLEEYVETLRHVFSKVRRVLTPDGTLWLNLGDGFENKQLLGVPWRVAFALQADGWYLRSDIIWAKPNPMPESVTDRPTKSHEYVFLLSKCERYYYDHEAIKEPSITCDPRRPYAPGQVDERGNGHDRGGGSLRPSVKRGGFDGKTNALKGREAFRAVTLDRNKRSVWTVATRPYAEAHFATYPPELIRPCILAGSQPGDTVLDPFTGSGTTAQVALEMSRSFVGIEINPEYVELARQRVQPLLDQPRLLEATA